MGAFLAERTILFGSIFVIVIVIVYCLMKKEVRGSGECGIACLFFLYIFWRGLVFLRAC